MSSSLAGIQRSSVRKRLKASFSIRRSRSRSRSTCTCTASGRVQRHSLELSRQNQSLAIVAALLLLYDSVDEGFVSVDSAKRTESCCFRSCSSCNMHSGNEWLIIHLAERGRTVAGGNYCTDAAEAISTSPPPFAD